MSTLNLFNLLNKVTIMSSTDKQDTKPKILVYGMNVSFDNEMTLIKSVLTIYSSIENLNTIYQDSKRKPSDKKLKSSKSKYLRPRLIDVLTFYVYKGYSTETKNEIKDTFRNINTQNLNQINAELTAKGYLIKDTYNFRKKHLNPQLQALRKYFLEGEYVNKPMFTVSFLKDLSV